VKAFIDDSALKSEGDVELSAQSAPTISAFTFAGALTAQGFGHGGGGFAGPGAGATPGHKISTTRSALVEADSEVEADGSIGLTATDSPFITANAGGFGLSLTAQGAELNVAIGASFSENQITDNVRAAIEASTVTAGENLELTANSDAARIHALTIGASLNVDIGNSGGVLFSGAGGVSANIIQNSVEAMVEEGSVVTTTNGEVALSATDGSTIDAQAWGFGFSFTVRQNASVSMGFGITLNTIGNVVQSQVDDATVSAGEGVSLKASSVPTITSLEVAAAISVNFNSKNVSAAV